MNFDPVWFEIPGPESSYNSAKVGVIYAASDAGPVVLLIGQRGREDKRQDTLFLPITGDTVKALRGAADIVARQLATGVEAEECEPVTEGPSHRPDPHGLPKSGPCFAETGKELHPGDICSLLWSSGLVMYLGEVKSIDMQQVVIGGTVYSSVNCVSYLTEDGTYHEMPESAFRELFGPA